MEATFINVMSFSESSKQHEWNPYLRTASNFLFYFSETAVRFHYLGGLLFLFLDSLSTANICTLLAKGTGSRDRIQIVGKNCIIQGLNNSVY